MQPTHPRQRIGHHYFKQTVSKFVFVSNDNAFHFVTYHKKQMLRRIVFLLLPIGLIFSCRNTEQKTFHENGQVKEVFQMNDEGAKHGSYTSYYEDGTSYEISTYNNGKFTGIRKLHYPDGSLEIEEMYNENGELNGSYATYYKNGQIMVKKTYKNNILEGEVTVYYENGQLKEKVLFTNNQENGPFTEYYQNGQVQWKGTYLNGPNEFGELEEYDSTGMLIKKMLCDSLAICRSTWKIENYDEKYKK